jgi:hypothetical protein
LLTKDFLKKTDCSEKNSVQNGKDNNRLSICIDEVETACDSVEQPISKVLDKTTKATGMAVTEMAVAKKTFDTIAKKAVT